MLLQIWKKTEKEKNTERNPLWMDEKPQMGWGECEREIPAFSVRENVKGRCVNFTRFSHASAVCSVDW